MIVLLWLINVYYIPVSNNITNNEIIIFLIKPILFNNIFITVKQEIT